jgi:hypothetical protein
MTNLLEETLKALEEAGATHHDVLWVGSRDGSYAIPWAAFAKLAGGVEYYAGYGSRKIAEDLVVVFREDLGWLERGEYDGSEWWEHKVRPLVQPSARSFERVTFEDFGYDTTLAKMNGEEA